MAEPVVVTDATFDAEVMQAEGPVLVDFWAEWCGPCKMIAPVLKEMASEQEGRLKIAKVDVDGNMATARKFGVSSIPTMILFKDGEVRARIVGAKSKSALLAEIDRHL